MGTLSVDLDKINLVNLDNGNFEEDDPETLLHIRLVTWHKRLALVRK